MPKTAILRRLQYRRFRDGARRLAAADWRETADMVSDGGDRILGEDPNGVLCVPARGEPGYWGAAFRWWNPAHWRFYLRSRVTGRVAFLCDDCGGRTTPPGARS